MAERGGVQAVGARAELLGPWHLRLETLARQTAAWWKRRNVQVVKIDWQFTTTDASVKPKKFYPTVPFQ